jgi:hypothetical protein
MRSALIGLVLAVGCGDQRPGPDADVSGDGSVAGLVRFRYALDTPESPAGATVFFQGPDGALISAQRTDEDGRANAFVPPGGSVTMAARSGHSIALWTYLGVQPGDELQLDFRNPFGSPRAVVMMTIPRFPGAAFYQLMTSCGSVSLNGSDQVPEPVSIPACADKVDMVLLARGGDGAIAGAIRAEGLEVKDNGSINITGTYLPVTMSNVSVVNVPIDAQSVDATRGSVGALDFMYSLRLQYPQPTPTGAQLTFSIPQGKAGAVVELSASSGITSEVTRFVTWGDANDHVEADLAHRLPRVLEEPRLVPGTRTLTWPEEQRGLVPDTVMATLQITQDPYFVSWQIIAPRGAEPTLALPVLPDPRFEPPLGGNIFVSQLIEATVDGGYDNARELVLERLESRSWPMAGPRGHATYQITTFGAD